ncbi:14937_t:CDS:2 [Entrophospora sp. SA101]|nr:14937_t:CDS:2 [Entrophospora sp. SA101]
MISETKLQHKSVLEIAQTLKTVQDINTKTSNNVYCGKIVIGLNKYIN